MTHEDINNKANELSIKLQETIGTSPHSFETIKSILIEMGEYLDKEYKKQWQEHRDMFFREVKKLCGLKAYNFTKEHGDEYIAISDKGQLYIKK